MIESAGMMRSIYITAWSSQMHGSEVSRSFVTTNSKSSSSFPSGSKRKKNKDRKKNQGMPYLMSLEVGTAVEC